MKIICCDKCQAFIPLTYDWQSCKCGTIKGRYKKCGRHADIVTKDKAMTRVIGVENCVRAGKKERGDAFKIKWDDKKLIVKKEIK